MQRNFVVLHARVYLEIYLFDLKCIKISMFYYLLSFFFLQKFFILFFFYYRFWNQHKKEKGKNFVCFFYIFLLLFFGRCKRNKRTYESICKNCRLNAISISVKVPKLLCVCVCLCVKFAKAQHKTLTCCSYSVGFTHKTYNSNIGKHYAASLCRQSACE